MSEPVFMVPLDKLADVELFGSRWEWTCRFECLGSSGYAGLSSQADTRDAAVAHLAEAHGLVRTWEGRELRAGDTTEIHYEGSRRSATVWHLGNITGPLVVVSDEVGK